MYSSFHKLNKIGNNDYIGTIGLIARKQTQKVQQQNSQCSVGPEHGTSGVQF